MAKEEIVNKRVTQVRQYTSWTHAELEATQILHNNMLPRKEPKPVNWELKVTVVSVEALHNPSPAGKHTVTIVMDINGTLSDIGLWTRACDNRFQYKVHGNHAEGLADARNAALGIPEPAPADRVSATELDSVMLHNIRKDTLGES